MLKSVLVFANGMVAACDENGNQIPTLQEKYWEVRDDLLRNVRKYKPEIQSQIAAATDELKKAKGGD